MFCHTNPPDALANRAMARDRRTQAKFRGVLLIHSMIALSACGPGPDLPYCPEVGTATDGNDVLYANGENDLYDVIEAGHGNDTIYVESGNFCRISGGDGDDIIRASFESKPIRYGMVLDGGSGNDQLYLSGTKGGLRLLGDAGNDILDASQHVGTFGVAIYGGSGDDTITGSDVDEPGRADTIDGEEGNDVINAGAGNDQIYGGEGQDIIDAGPGRDRIFGGYGQDVINGGAGDDAIFGDQGEDVINGGTGDDAINGDQGEDVINGGTGDDTIYGDQGEDVIYGDAGDDTIYGGYGTGRGTGEYDIIYGGAGNDTIYADGSLGSAGKLQGEHKLFGEDGDDTILYFSGNSIISGGAGEDALRLPSTGVLSTAGDGTITLTDGDYNAFLTGIELFWLEGGSEDDTITTEPPLDLNIEIVGINGGDGDDTITVLNTTGSRVLELYGAAGNDQIDASMHGGTHGVRISGGSGSDTITGSNATYVEGDRDAAHAEGDLIYGADGNDTIKGGDGNDEIYGGFHNDTIYGGSGNDTIHADSTVPKEDGTAGDDRLFGEDGDDTLYCFGGDSFIDGGAGVDTLWILSGYTLLGTENGTVTISDGDNTLSYADIESVRNIDTDAIYNFG